MLTDWTRSETISQPNEIIIKYKTASEEKEVILKSTPRSLNTTYHEPFVYIDKDKKQQTTEIVTSQVDEKRTTIAAVNPAYIEYRLSKQQGLPSGDVWSRSETKHSYITSIEGPKKVREVVSEYITEWQLAGSLAIKNYDNYTPTAETFESQRTETIYKEWIGRDGRAITQTRTSRWMSLGLSQEGQQAAQKMCAAFASKTDGSLQRIVDACKQLIFEGTEVQTQTGRAPVPEMPSDADLVAEEVMNGSDKTDTTGNGIPDWAEYDPNDPADYDDNGDGISDWIDLDSLYDSATRNIGTDFTVSNGITLEGINVDEDTGLPIDPVSKNPVKASKDVTVKPLKDFTLKSVSDFQIDPLTLALINPSTQGPYAPEIILKVDPLTRALLNPSTEGPYAPEIIVPLDPTTGESDFSGVGLILDPNAVFAEGPYNPAVLVAIDPDTGEPLDPDYGLLIQPSTDDIYLPGIQVAIDPDTEQPVDQTVGYQVDPDTGDIFNPPRVTEVDPDTGMPVDPAGNSVTAEYEMPYAPDDVIEFVDGVRTIVPGNNEDVAELFGETEAALDFGHAYGQNIVTGFNEVPSLQLAPLYVQLDGIEGAFLLDAMSYAWGPEGMVVSSDLMLIGITGKYGSNVPSASWLRSPVLVSQLDTISEYGTIEANPKKANTIAIPTGFNARNPAATLALLPKAELDVFAEWRSGVNVVAPLLINNTYVITTQPYLLVTEFPYSLITEVETQVLMTQPLLVARESRGVTPPDGMMVVAGQPPAISTGAAIRPSAAAIQVAGMAPDLATGAAVAVPAASITVTAHALVVEASGIVQVPTAQITVEGLAPAFIGQQGGDYFAGWSDQVYGYDRDWQPDWWAD